MCILDGLRPTRRAASSSHHHTLCVLPLHTYGESSAHTQQSRQVAGCGIMQNQQCNTSKPGLRLKSLTAHSNINMGYL
jgi:hypothetical protein